MSDPNAHAHGHDSHSQSHDDHGAHDDHGGHDEHGHGEGHEEHWGDYNSAAPEPSQLPPVSPALLIAFGTALIFLLCMIVASSFMLATADEKRPQVEAEAGQHEGHGEKKEARKEE